MSTDSWRTLGGFGKLIAFGGFAWVMYSLEISGARGMLPYAALFLCAAIVFIAFCGGMARKSESPASNTGAGSISMHQHELLISKQRARVDELHREMLERDREIFALRKELEELKKARA